MSDTHASAEGKLTVASGFDPDAPDTAVAGECACPRPSAPCGIIIFGASGDLTARKIMPALYRLFLSDMLPQSFYILGCARTGMHDDAFRGKMKEAVLRGEQPDAAGWDAFEPRLYYEHGEYADERFYHAIAQRVSALDARHGTHNNRLYYLAIPPFLFETVIAMTGRAGLSCETCPEDSWCRIIVEKPFGSDVKTARRLNAALHEHFHEHQIYRIDHYLAKETVQNILAFRFANAIFEPLWSRDYIDYVDISAAETIGVGHRSGYYERAGVLRDMFQNHMLQLLSLTAMEPPARFMPEPVRDEKAKVFRALRPFESASIKTNIVLGQYAAGMVQGEHQRSYREEPGVAHGSLTPTYAMMKVYVDN